MIFEHIFSRTYCWSVCSSDKLLLDLRKFDLGYQIRPKGNVWLPTEIEKKCKHACGLLAMQTSSLNCSGYLPLTRKCTYPLKREIAGKITFCERKPEHGARLSQSWRTCAHKKTLKLEANRNLETHNLVIHRECVKYSILHFKCSPIPITQTNLTYTLKTNYWRSILKYADSNSKSNQWFTSMVRFWLKISGYLLRISISIDSSLECRSNYSTSVKPDAAYFPAAAHH